MDKIELLKEECRLNNCNFLNIDSIYSNFYKKLSEIFTTKVHEKKIIKCGTIFTDNTDLVIKYSTRNIINEDLTDGETVFELVNRKGETICAIFEKQLSHIDLVTISKTKNTVIITKNENTIFIYSKSVIYVIENRRWTIRKNFELLPVKLKYILPDLKDDYLAEILKFAIYELSLNKIGTTIVYNTEVTFNFRDITKKEECNLNISDTKLLLNYLSYHDGAILVNNENKVIFVNAFLNADPQINKENEYSGTRHTSACNFSYRNPNVIVITVSEDGPVSVFFRGKEISNSKITTNRNFSVNLNSYEQMATDIDEVSEINTDTVTCSTCNTEYEVQYISITGNNDKETLECEICGNTYFSKHCFLLEGVMKAINF